MEKLDTCLCQLFQVFLFLQVLAIPHQALQEGARGIEELPEVLQHPREVSIVYSFIELRLIRNLRYFRSDDDVTLPENFKFEVVDMEALYHRFVDVYGPSEMAHCKECTEMDRERVEHPL